VDEGNSSQFCKYEMIRVELICTRNLAFRHGVIHGNSHNFRVEIEEKKSLGAGGNTATP
jgi:hypothetical protein